MMDNEYEVEDHIGLCELAREIMMRRVASGWAFRDPNEFVRRCFEIAESFRSHARGRWDPVSQNKK